MPQKRGTDNTQETSDNPSPKQHREDAASLEKEDDFIELEERNLDDGAFDTSMVGEDDINLQESSAKHPATGNVTEIKRKFHEFSAHAVSYTHLTLPTNREV